MFRKKYNTSILNKTDIDSLINWIFDLKKKHYARNILNYLCLILYLGHSKFRNKINILISLDSIDILISIKQPIQESVRFPISLL